MEAQGRMLSSVLVTTRKRKMKKQDGKVVDEKELFKGIGVMEESEKVQTTQTHGGGVGGEKI